MPALPIRPRSLVLSGILVGLAACSKAPGPMPTSVILVVVDTLRADYVFDRSRAATPNLDALFDESVVFPRAYTHTSWTLPSHTALFSSRPPHATGVELNSQSVPADLPLLAEWLRKQGYATRAVHSLVSLTPVRAGGGLDRGFDEFRERLDMGFARAETVDAEVEPILGDLAARDRPFFLFVHYSDPHEPLHPYGTAVRPAELRCNGAVVHTVDNLCEPQWIRARFALAPGRNEIRLESEANWTPRVVRAEVAGRELEVGIEIGADEKPFGVIANETDAAVEVDFTLYAYEVLEPDEQRRRYALEIEHLDRFLGALRDEIAQLGRADDVLLVFTADHGEGLGEHGQESHGLTVYDELLHVPLAIRPPKGSARTAALAANADALVRHVDLAPTILDLIGAPALPGQTGTSLARPLAPPSPRSAGRTLEAEAHYPLSPDMYAVFDGRWKLVYVPDNESWVLFDLEQDPDETRDVLAENALALAPTLEAWKERLRAMRAAAEASFAGQVQDLPPELREQLEAVGYAGRR